MTAPSRSSLPPKRPPAFHRNVRKIERCLRRLRRRDPQALYDLARKAREPEYVIRESLRGGLRARGLIDDAGNLPNVACGVVLCATRLDGQEVHLLALHLVAHLS